MRSISKFFSLAIFAGLAALSAGAQQQIDPTSGIQWNLGTAAGAPAAACTQNGQYVTLPYAAQWGQSYTNQTNGDYYVCTPLGWLLKGAGSGLPINNPTFTGVMTGPDYIDSALTPGASPICPNGTGGRFTTSGCTGGGGGGGYPALLTTAYSGADFGARVNLCTAAATAAGGGTCDARGDTLGASSNEDVTFGDGVNNIAYILPLGTFTLASGHKFLKHSYVSVTGTGYGTAKASSLQCTSPVGGCVVQGPEPAGLQGIYMANFNINAGGSPGAGSIGLQVGQPVIGTYHQIAYALPYNGTGTGYSVGNTVRPTGGDSTAVLTVASVSGGVPTSYTVTAPGSNYSYSASSSTSTLVGSGSGAQVSVYIWNDELNSIYYDLGVGVGGSANFATGTMIDSPGGCICYDHFYNITSGASVAGIHAANDSGYAFGFNSDSWVEGRAGGEVGIWDSGSAGMKWDHVDLENNISTNGSILMAMPYNGTGTGYTVGTTIRPVGGDSTAVLTVASVSSGVPTSYTVTTAGATYTNNSSGSSVATSTLSGSGSGATVDLIVSAHLLELSNGGSNVIIGYEEAGGNDYICGVGNYVHGAYDSGAGTTYAATRYCTGAAIPGGYGGPPSNFIWGSGMTPNSIGLSSSLNPSQPYTEILFGSDSMYDDFNSSLFALGVSTQGGSALVHPLEWRYASRGVALGYFGHAPFEIGQLTNTGGQDDTGYVSISALPDPSAPTVANVGAAGSATYQYEVVCAGPYNSLIPGPTYMTSLPSAVGQTTTGNATLSGTNYNTIASFCGDGYSNTYVLKNVSGTYKQLAVYSASGNIVTQDTGQSTSTFTLPTRNNTSDVSISGYHSAAQYSIGTNVVIPTGVSGYQGTSGTKVQLGVGAPTAGHCADFAADGSIQDAGGACATGGSGQPYGAVSATFSSGAATYPSLASANTINVAPSANVTSASCPTGAATGGIYYINFTQPAGGGLTNTWPSCFQNFATPAVEANAVTSCTTQFTGTNFQYPVCTNSSGHGIAPWQSTPAAPGSTGTSYPFTSSADNGDQEAITSAGTFKEFLAGQDCNPVTGVCAIPYGHVTGRPWQCQDGIGGGTAALSTGTYATNQICINKTGATITITGSTCSVDAGSTSTVTVTDGSGNNLLASTLTCASGFATAIGPGSTTTIAAGGYIKWTPNPDGTAKSLTFTIYGTY
jgi:hypothetical protein